MTHSEPHAKTTVNDANLSIVETMTVNSVRGKPSVRYTMTRREASISIDADSTGGIQVQSDRELDSHSRRRVSIEQLAGKPIRMHCTITSEQNPKGESYTVQGSTWLHLREADRMVVASDIEPILDELLQPYSLGELADRAHSYSLQQPYGVSNDDPMIEESQIKAWIHELRSPSRLRRMEAQRRLTEVGISLLPRLANLDASLWDAEQRQRLSEIQTKLTPMAEDDSMRLAVLIRDDFDYWRLAASRLDDRERQYVVDRFQRIGGPAPFSRSESSRIATRPEAPSR